MSHSSSLSSGSCRRGRSTPPFSLYLPWRRKRWNVSEIVVEMLDQARSHPTRCVLCRAEKTPGLAVVLHGEPVRVCSNCAGDYRRLGRTPREAAEEAVEQTIEGRLRAAS